MKKQSFTHSRKPKFGMRKLSIGLASCMLGMMFLTTGHANADDNTGHVGETLRLVPGQWGTYGVVSEFQADKTKEGVMYTKWLDGVTVDDSQFQKLKDDDGTEYWATPLSNDMGYYDINKDFNQDSDKCSAAVAVNMFHYWLDRNRSSIGRYLEQSPENGVFRDGSAKLKDFLETYSKDGKYKDASKLFDLISDSFKGPVWTDKLLDLYINGYGYKESYGRNIGDSRKNESGFNFFKKVFDGKFLTDVHTIGDQDHLSSLLSDALYTGKAIGLSYGPADLYRSLGHIISVWGADFDEHHRVVAVYVTDSDDKKLTVGNERLGLKRYKVSTDDQNRVRLTAYAQTNNTGGRVRSLFTLDSAKYDWADYFNKTNSEQ
ncbi:TPA: IdeS/Mac family cysteine endopeptidase [Streptococcus equi subsp. zooepidemicus]|nr:IdeS/Mac family cysteine endopeptidase [Streptococcus equi subsp. zooepidemicus]HEL0023782.1 IdeS/Mac family cysteine endopeptidase [Streptococcus equi subsp. zooepidemicus]HEL1075745.1 IdeS/Mac family cysteine endopeptidase [Streptococcus equi subsp. zooepidemicus]HEL1116509.1 IdeS/Mac family cysteine endopeptidase [Streptococcus equi subsp. zooepidemicus]HEL1170104.1 IdeS/Mac family cysteine endopeptidase [Streptococcus equi subsp. zooepidemicus]